MIGVIARKEEAAVVEEFFQLFKTPWEWFRPGQTYDVVLVSNSELPAVDASLVVVYGTEMKSVGGRTIRARSRLQNAKLNYRGEKLPLYGGTLSFEKGLACVVCATTTSEVTGLQMDSAGKRVVRIGYNLFQEIEFLLTVGQPVENASAPSLELHIAVLRDLILDAGLPLLEIPPAPAGYDFAVCLTHDIDFVGIRRHKFDHTMWGFLYRSTLSATLGFLREKIPLTRLLKIWRAAASLPIVYLGWVEDFWIPFDWYLRVENGLASTYYFIPFKGRRGDKVSAPHVERRASAYDIADIPDWIAKLSNEGCETGVHGIDAWHNAAKGREERERVAAATGQAETGIRMHWLLQDVNSYRVLEEAGYSYDSTAGYNETIGYRCGTTQAFRPLSAQKLLELPLHVQDGALFFPNRLNLSETEAGKCCASFIENAKRFGGVLTILWHDRSHGPERFWGDFYVELVGKLKSLDAWFATGSQAVGWFRNRREVVFERGSGENRGCVKLSSRGGPVMPGFRVRVHAAGKGGQKTDFVWHGDREFQMELSQGTAREERVEALSTAAAA